MSDSESDALPLGYTPMCLFIIHDLCFFDKCFLCKTLVFLRFRQKIGSIVRKCLELMSFSHWVVKIIGEKKRIYKWEVK